MTLAAVTEDTSLERALATLEWRLLEASRVELPELRQTTLPGGTMRFHYVVTGSLDLRTPGESLTLRAGDFVLLSGVAPHVVTAAEPAVVVTGALQCAGCDTTRLVGVLPDVLVACGFSTRDPDMAQLVEILVREVAGSDGRPGSSVIADRFATLIASAAVRSWAENGGALESWLVGQRDPHIARAIEAMRGDPGNAWTLESLARVARSSRSVFAGRFRELVGESPTRYLTALRMEQAERLLRSERLTIGEAAQRLGYGSDAAFSRAFRRHAGESPATWRRRALQPNP
ncbi:AraC family transcriptional regulator [Leifsonia poae]|uniref:AraC family transcriptional regulator n=1 Tax=Leifsonia poae TaxID=110933 RepID=A0A9W6H7S4_9MICO|nr:AraC family transcriptional regulator [Leifsonia poae]GLJ74843.1 AraC family transcriptional regulator [Leifsonia poae]